MCNHGIRAACCLHEICGLHFRDELGQEQRACKEEVMFKRIRRSVSLAGLSAGIMYMFDPDLGRRRRSLLRDQFDHAVDRFGRAIDVLGRDLQNRLYGTVCELQQMFRGHDTSDDAVLARVRTTLGRYTSHPRSIETHVRDERVILSGPILADEVDDLVSAVKAVYGVRHVENKLDVHQSAENVSALQGGMCAPGASSDGMQQNWSPTTRFIAGALGGVAILNCLAKRTLPAMVAGTGGLLLFVRALSNQELLGAFEKGGVGRGRGRTDAATSARQRQEVPAGSNAPHGSSDRRTIGTFGGDGGAIPDDQLVDEALEESFPASDAPSFTRR
jgi:hypothetical protein